jgi:hypothetical protein
MAVDRLGRIGWPAAPQGARRGRRCGGRRRGGGQEEQRRRTQTQGWCVWRQAGGSNSMPIHPLPVRSHPTCVLAQPPLSPRKTRRKRMTTMMTMTTMRKRKRRRRRRRLHHPRRRPKPPPRTRSMRTRLGIGGRGGPGPPDRGRSSRPVGTCRRRSRRATAAPARICRAPPTTTMTTKMPVSFWFLVSWSNNAPRCTRFFAHVLAWMQ